jgi:hypothetical protein
LQLDDGFGAFQAQRQTGIIALKACQISRQRVGFGGLRSAFGWRQCTEGSGVPLLAPFGEGRRINALTTQDGTEGALPTTTDTSRRRLFATAASALVAGAALATAAHGAPIAEAAGGDAELLALVREYHQHDAVAVNADLREAIWEAAQDLRWTVFDQIEKTPARTPAGWAAKASLLPRTVDDSGDPTSPEGRMALSLARDLMGTAPLPPPDNRDAELITACHTFLVAEAELQAINGSDDDNDDAGHRAIGHWCAALDRLTDLPALTPAGMRTKAHAAHIALLSTEDPGDLQREEAAALSVLSDLIGRAAA